MPSYATSNNAVKATINETIIGNSKEEKLFGTKLDTTLSFKSQTFSLCKTPSQKLHALAQIANYIELVKRRSFMKAFITLKSKYYPSIWMFHTKGLNNSINKMSKH